MVDVESGAPFCSVNIEKTRKHYCDEYKDTIQAATSTASVNIDKFEVQERARCSSVSFELDSQK